MYSTRTLNSDRGFTLIELLVVIAIIGILASVVVASMGRARAKSRDARRLADMKQIVNALEIYAGDNSNLYPVQSVTTAYVSPTNIVALATNALTALDPILLGDIPADPLPSQRYYYVTNASGSVYCLAMQMENGNTRSGCPNSTLNSALDTISGSTTMYQYKYGYSNN